MFLLAYVIVIRGMDRREVLVQTSLNEAKSAQCIPRSSRLPEDEWGSEPDPATRVLSIIYYNNFNSENRGEVKGLHALRPEASAD